MALADLAPTPPGPLLELASGVDALYLSGRCEIPGPLLADLEATKALARDNGQAQPFDVAGETWLLSGYAWGNYAYCLDREVGRLGLTASAALPSVRVQPRAELLHGIGPAPTVELFDSYVRAACGDVVWTVSRLDLHADWQGWSLHRDLSERFLCRADHRAIHEESERCTGFTFGKRSSGRINARIYDKTLDVRAKGTDWWFDVWGERYDPSQDVYRIEFEFGREALRSMQVSSPEEVLAASGDLWRYASEDWLTLRTATTDQTKSRWPVAPEWECVQRPTLRHELLGISRLKERARLGALRLLMPSLNGSLTSAAVHLGTSEIWDTMAAVAPELRSYEESTGIRFPHRVDEKRRRLTA